MNFDQDCCENYFLSLMFSLVCYQKAEWTKITTIPTKPCGFDSVYIDSHTWAEQRIKGTLESLLIAPVLGKTIEDNAILGSAKTIYLDSCQPKTCGLMRFRIATSFLI